MLRGEGCNEINKGRALSAYDKLSTFQAVSPRVLPTTGVVGITVTSLWMRELSLGGCHFLKVTKQRARA